MKTVIGLVWTLGCMGMVVGVILLIAGVVVWSETANPQPFAEIEAYVKANPFQSGVVLFLAGMTLAIGGIGLADRYGK